MASSGEAAAAGFGAFMEGLLGIVQMKMAQEQARKRKAAKTQRENRLARAERLKEIQALQEMAPTLRQPAPFSPSRTDTFGPILSPGQISGTQ